MTEKKCSACGVTKPTTEFYRRARSQDGYEGSCRACRLAYNREHYRRTGNSDIRRERHYQLAYGVSLADVKDLWERQEGRCALCGRPEADSHNGLHLDHDHITGRVRALLCVFCNTGLGKLQDDPDLLRRAADYIEEHRGRSVTIL